MTKWINLRDKTPERNARVLICGNRGGVTIAKYVPESNNFWSNYKHTFVDAKWWMDLPDRPKGINTPWEREIG